MISTDGTKLVGDFRGNKPWNLSLFDKDGNIIIKFVNGEKNISITPPSKTNK
jgi:hypothetical protein